MASKTEHVTHHQFSLNSTLTRVPMLQHQPFKKVLIMVAIFQMAISTTLLFALLLMVAKIFALLATKSFMLLIPLKLITGTMVHKQSVATSVLVVTHLFG